MWGPGPQSPRQKGPRQRRLASVGTVALIVGLVLLLLFVASRYNPTPHSPSGTSVKATTGFTSSTARVSVVNRGFTQSGGQAGNSISYGVVLQNDDSTLTAVAVKIRETFVDSRGRSVATDSQTLTGLPPGSRFYVGGDVVSNVSVQVSKFTVAVKVGGSVVTSRLLIPPVTSVSLVKSQFNEDVEGAFRNPYKVQLPSDATIFLVYTNSDGQIVGGDSESTGATVQPGAIVSFSDTLLSVTPSIGATVEASIDPDGYPTPGSGEIHWTS